MNPDATRSVGRVPLLSSLLSRLTEKKKIESELYYVITYMFGVATSFSSLEDMFGYVARSEFKHCAKIFDRIRVLAKRWHIGFIRSIELTARTIKSKLLQDFLERFSQMLKTGDAYNRFLLVEHEAYVAGFEAEYDRSLKSIETLSNAYSAIATSVIFVTITITLTQALMSFGGSQDIMPYFVLAIIVTVFTSVFAMYVSSPIDRFAYVNRELNIPKEFRRLDVILVPALICSFAAALPCLLLRLGPEWILMAFFVPLMAVGVLAKRADDAILRRENAFPTFIRTLGSTAGITGYSTSRSLKLLLVRDFGVLSVPVRNLHAKLSIGAEQGLCWRNLASQCGSEMIRIFSGIYSATTFLGGDPAEIGKMISRNMIRMIVMRAKRIQIANGIKAMIYPLHAIQCILLAFMTSLLDILIRMVNLGSSYMEIFKSSMSSTSVAVLFFFVSVVMAFANALAIKTVDIGSRYKWLYSLSVLMVITGATWIGANYGAKYLFNDLFNLKFIGDNVGK
jgi:flagellar protein FlaJ